MGKSGAFVPSELKMVVLLPAGALTFPWSMAGRIAATQMQKERGGTLAIGVTFQSADRKRGHRLDFDFNTGKEIVDGPNPR